MINYYETLEIGIESSSEEIENAIDNQYNHWRQLVSHHDPETVIQANQALLVLEEIRSTLLDDTKRNNYNETLKLNEKIGGLGDSGTVLKNLSIAGKRKLHDKKIIDKIERTDAWVCHSCDKANRIGTSFCEKCGKIIAKPCPSCSSLAPISNEFCPNCGSNKFDAFENIKAIDLQELNNTLTSLQSHILNIENGDVPFAADSEDQRFKMIYSLAFYSSIVTIISLIQGAEILGIVFFLITIIFIFSAARKKSLSKEIRTNKINEFNQEIAQIQSEIKKISAAEYMVE